MTYLNIAQSETKWEWIGLLKYRSFFCTLTLLCILFTINSGRANQVKNITKLPHSPLIVVLDDNYPPYTFRDQSGKLRGILPEQWDLWTKRTEIPIRLIGTEWIKAQKMLLRGEADIIDTIFCTPERTPLYDFTKPYADIRVSIFYNSTISGISDISSLQGFAVAVKEGDACIEVLKKGGISSFIRYPCFEKIIKDAASGKIKVFCMDDPPAYYFLTKYEIARQFKKGFTLYTGHFHRAVRKGRIDILKLVEKGFEFINPEELAKIDKKWLGKPLGLPIYYRYLKFTILGSGILILVFFVWNELLRRAVHKKTKELESLLCKTQKKEELHRVTLYSMGEGVITTDKNGNILEMNPIAEQITGWPLEDARTKKIEEVFKLVDEKSGEKIGCPVMETIKKNKVVKLASDICLVGRDGQFTPVADSAAPIKDREGVIFGAVVVFRDQTAEKTLHEQLLKAEKLQSIGRLAGGIAHAFNNLLTVIIGNTQLAMRSVSVHSSIYQDLHETLKAAIRSKELVKQLLAFARKQTIKPEVLDLNEVIENIKEMLARLVGENIQIKFVPGKDLWKTKIDQGQAGQILVNLAANARDAITGNGEIIIETRNIRLDEDYVSTHTEARPGEYVLLIFSDNGCGMDRETLDHIFEPFYTTKKESKGTGLGLATVYGIVKQHNGFINVYSEPEQGTTFKIYFPNSKPEFIQRTRTSENKPIGGNETILIVDDENQILNICRKNLEQLGYNVLVTDSPLQAVKLAKEYLSEIDLLITDLVMPKMSGKELSEKIRRLNPQVKVLFISGYPSSVTFKRFIIHEQANFLEKPFTFQDLSEKVRTILDSR